MTQTSNEIRNFPPNERYKSKYMELPFIAAELFWLAFSQVSSLTVVCFGCFFFIVDSVFYLSTVSL